MLIESRSLLELFKNFKIYIIGTVLKLLQKCSCFSVFLRFFYDLFGCKPAIAFNPLWD